MKINIKTGLTAIIIFIAIATTLSVSASATTVSIADVTIGQGNTTTIPIMINDVMDLGSATIDLNYNGTAVVNVTSGSNSQFTTIIVTINNSIGKTRITGFQIGNGLTGNIKLANITLQAVGSAGTTSPLNLSIITLKTFTPPQQSISAAVDNGTFTITGAPQATFNISGYKINDTNGNGIWNAGEQGLANWKIALLTSGHVEIENTTTNSQGFYVFNDLAHGTYHVMEELKAGWINTSAAMKVITIVDSDVINQNFTNFEDRTPPSVTNSSANPSEILREETNNADYQHLSTRLNVTATDLSGVSSVTINLSSIGGSANAVMAAVGNNVYSITANATGLPGSKSLRVNATDIYGNSNTSVSITLSVVKNGDVNSDGVTDVADAMWLANNIAGSPGFGTINELASEVNGDGIIDVADAMYIANYIAGTQEFDKLY